MRWEDERYVRVYTRDTADWMALSWDAQSLFMHLLRKVDRAGILALGKHGKKAVAVVLGQVAIWNRLSDALDELLADGCVRVEGDLLVVPNFIEAQEAVMSGALRTREWREKAKEAIRDEASRGGDEASRNVTSGDAARRGVTRRDSSRAVPSVPNRTDACAEVEQPTSTPPLALIPASPPVVSLPCVGRGPVEYGVTEAEIADWSSAFPGVDVLAEVRKARVWLDADPKRRKTHGGVKRFIVGWLTRTQNGPRVNGTHRPPVAVQARLAPLGRPGSLS